MSEREATIVVNGTTLTEAQSMTLRVALGSFLIDLGDPEYMAALGPIGALYQGVAYEVQALILRRRARGESGGGR